MFLNLNLRAGIIGALLVLCANTLFTQPPAFNAQEKLTPYTGQFRPGYNSGWQSGWTDQTMANLAAGNPAVGAKGVGLTTNRQGLFYELLKTWGSAVRVPEMKHYESLKMGEMTAMILGGANGGSEYGPPDDVRDQTAYCPTQKTQLFRNLYLPIWDNGANGTPYNENNYFAAFLYQTVDTYKDHVRFWEIWNEPGYDLTYNTGWRPKGDPAGNWWDRNPQPCEYMLRGPLPSYVRMLRIAYEIVKKLDPDSYVCISSPGYPSFLDAILRNTDNPDQGKVSAEYPLTGGAYFEGIAYHAYPHFDGSTVVQRVPNILYERTSDRCAQGLVMVRDSLQVVLERRGFDGKKYPKKEFIITETNMPRKSYGNPAYFGNELVQRNFMPKAYVNCKINRIHQMHIYSLAENKPESQVGGEFDIMGLYQNISGLSVSTVKVNESGIALRTTSELLHNTDYDKAMTDKLKAPPTVRAEAFKRADGKYVFVLWAKTAKDLSEEASATFSFPQGMLSNAKLQAWDASQTGQTTDTNGSGLALTGTPIFIVANAEGGGGGGGGTPPVIPVVAAVGPTAICNGQAALLRVTNKCAGCTVLWSNGQRADTLRATQAGTYTATQTNSEGLSSTASNSIVVTVASPSIAPVVSIVGNTAICPGDSATLRANLVCAGCTVRWSNGQTGATIRVAQAGTYTATTQLPPCNTPSAASNSVTVTSTAAATAPTIAVTGSNTTLCSGTDSVVLRASNVCNGCVLRWSTGATTTSIAARSVGTYTVTARPASCERATVASNAITVLQATAPAAPLVTATGPTAICLGDSVTLRANNVCAGCTVNWSNGRTGATITVRQAGSYRASVQASGCTINSLPSTAVDVTIATAPQAPTIAAAGSTDLCTQDSIVLRATSVCNGCTVQWSTGQSGATIAVRRAGAYTATMRAPGCSNASPASNSVQVTSGVAPAAPQISADGPTAICEGGIAVLRARNVCTNCTVEWSNGETGANLVVETAGTYTALVRTAGSCTTASVASNAITVTLTPQPTRPVIQKTGQNNMCQGQSTTLTVSNICPGCALRWSTGSNANSIVVEKTGIYTVVSRNACGRSQPAADTVRERLYLPQITVTNTCVLTAPAGRDYRWFLNGLEILASVDRASWTATANGVYNVAMTSADGCKGISLPVSVQNCTRPEPPESRTGGTVGVIHVFPNPADDVTYLQMQPEVPADAVLEIYNTNGVLLHRQEQEENAYISMTVDTDSLPAGLYFYQLRVGQQKYQGKFVVRR
jgi:Secretion system C-terminal sorting domain